MGRLASSLVPRPFPLSVFDLALFPGAQFRAPGSKAIFDHFHICILQAIKYWRREQPGNEAMRRLYILCVTLLTPSLPILTHTHPNTATPKKPSSKPSCLFQSLEFFVTRLALGGIAMLSLVKADVQQLALLSKCG